eukprot:TCONS_00057216-protein
MVFWLISNGANVHAKTVGEDQAPIHYAAKYNAEDSLKVLLHMGANIEDKDYKNRTPLFVAAETGRSGACTFLLEQGAPAGVYDNGGRLALSLMVQKMPDVAKIALGQFVTVDKALRKKYYYLNYLETDTWSRLKSPNYDNQSNSRDSNNNGGSLKKTRKKSRKKNQRDYSMSDAADLNMIALEKMVHRKYEPLPSSSTTLARGPLETICEYNEAELIMNPVILRLIAIKWQLYGNYRTGLSTAINLLYTILWTALGITMPRDDVTAYYSPLSDNIWRICLEVISLILAVYFIVKQVVEVQRSETRERKYKEWKKRELERDLMYCHERWPEEHRYLTSEINLIETSSKRFMKNGWNGFEMFTNLIMAMVIITRVVAVTLSNPTLNTIHYKSVPMLLILLWLRFMRYCQIYQSLGPFITMLSHVIGDTLKFGFLFFEFFIPYVCAFWILFGGQPGTEYERFNDVIYQVFLMTLVDEYEREELMKQDKVMAQVLVGTYLAIASVVCLNLYIALMSQTFTRIYQNATATAYMQQAKHLLTIERSLSKRKRTKVQRFMANECSPQVVYDNGVNDDDEDDNVRFSLYRLVNSVNEIKDKMGIVMVESATSTHHVNANTKISGGIGSSGDDIVRSSLHSTNVTSLQEQQKIRTRMDSLEETTEEMNTKIDEVHSLLKTINESFRNNIESNKNNPKMIEFAALPNERGAEAPESKSTKDEKEKRNSWDQKLMSVIAAFTNKDKQATTALDSGHSQVYQTQPHPGEALMDRRQHLHTPFTRHPADNSFSTLPRNYQRSHHYPEDISAPSSEYSPYHPMTVPRKFSSLHDVSYQQQRSSPHLMSPTNAPHLQSGREGSPYPSQFHQEPQHHPTLTKMRSMPAGGSYEDHLHPQQFTREGYYTTSPLAPKYRNFINQEAQYYEHSSPARPSSARDFLERRDRELTKPNHLGSASATLPRKSYRKKSKSPKSSSRESKSPIRRHHYQHENLNLDSPDKRRQHQEKEDSKLNSTERTRLRLYQDQEDKSKRQIYLEVKKKKRHQQSIEASSSENESSDPSSSSELESPESPSSRENTGRVSIALEKEGLTRNQESSASRIRRDKDDDYNIGFEKLSDDTRQTNNETSESPSKRKKQDKEKKKVDRKARSSAKISESDIATVSQLLSEHGFQSNSLRDNLDNVKKGQSNGEKGRLETMVEPKNQRTTIPSDRKTSKVECSNIETKKYDTTSRQIKDSTKNFDSSKTSIDFKQEQKTVVLPEKFILDGLKDTNV